MLGAARFESTSRVRSDCYILSASFHIVIFFLSGDEQYKKNKNKERVGRWEIPWDGVTNGTVKALLVPCIDYCFVVSHLFFRFSTGGRGGLTSLLAGDRRRSDRLKNGLRKAARGRRGNSGEGGSEMTFRHMRALGFFITLFYVWHTHIRVLFPAWKNFYLSSPFQNWVG